VSGLNGGYFTETRNPYRLLEITYTILAIIGIEDFRKNSLRRNK
jgi:hypothetical protein